jgi:hypothetical protein
LLDPPSHLGSAESDCKIAAAKNAIAMHKRLKPAGVSGEKSNL